MNLNGDYGWMHEVGMLPTTSRFGEGKVPVKKKLLVGVLRSRLPKLTLSSQRSEASDSASFWTQSDFKIASHGVSILQQSPFVWVYAQSLEALPKILPPILPIKTLKKPNQGLLLETLQYLWNIFPSSWGFRFYLSSLIHQIGKHLLLGGSLWGGAGGIPMTAEMPSSQPCVGAFAAVQHRAGHYWGESRQPVQGGASCGSCGTWFGGLKIEHIPRVMTSLVGKLMIFHVFFNGCSFLSDKTIWVWAGLKLTSEMDVGGLSMMR